ncbi:hypothetical protein BWQ92_22875 [Arthrobacter sp. QXT-31]|nr:hypothetical protein BWQ92_22875 [Arthrobacter sp. QXT-31]
MAAGLGSAVSTAAVWLRASYGDYAKHHVLVQTDTLYQEAQVLALELVPGLLWGNTATLGVSRRVFPCDDYCVLGAYLGDGAKDRAMASRKITY